MSKIKLDDRIENAVNAFFEKEPRNGTPALRYDVHHEMTMAVEPPFSEKFGKWSAILRGLFLFGPGTLFLYFLTLMLIFFYPTIGIPIPGLIMLASMAFMTYAGAGDIRHIKNLAVPATVIAVAAVVAVIRSIFPVPEYLSPEISWSLYSFPVALVAAKLVQMRVAEKN